MSDEKDKKTCSNQNMARARKNILHDKSIAHITWRCHNRQFYLQSEEIKTFVYKTLLTCKKIHQIKIIEYVFMSNHIHLLVGIKDRKRMSDFMRHANSIIARKINAVFEKRSQAIEDRYKSPVIQDEGYCLNTISYIWSNPTRAGIVPSGKPEDYYWSSLYRRSRGLIDPLVDGYHEIEKLVGYLPCGTKSAQRFSRELLNRSMDENPFLTPEIYESLHSIGSDEFRRSRRKVQDTS